MFKRIKNKRAGSELSNIEGEKNGLVKNVVRLSRHENDLVEFESLRTGKSSDFISVVVQTEWWGLLLKGGMRKKYKCMPSS